MVGHFFVRVHFSTPPAGAGGRGAGGGRLSVLQELVADLLSKCYVFSTTFSIIESFVLSIIDDVAAPFSSMTRGVTFLRCLIYRHLAQNATIYRQQVLDLWWALLYVVCISSTHATSFRWGCNLGILRGGVAHQFTPVLIINCWANIDVCL